jgi:predicted Zn-dependent protease
MLTKDQAAEIFAKLRRYTSADEIEAIFYGGHSALTRFANNTIHQNVAEEHYGVSVRTTFGGRTARASTNKLDDDSLRQVVQSSEAIAKVQEPNPDLLAMPDRDEVQGNGGAEPDSIPARHYQRTAETTPDARAHAVEKMVRIAQEHKLTAAGIFATSDGIEGIFNSRGVAEWHRQTSSDISITMLGANSSGWQKSNSPNVADLNPSVLAETAARKAIDSANPKEISAGKYTVILEPAAVLDIVGFMFYDFGGLAILDQRSFLNNRVGTAIFGDNIHISDDVAHPLQSGAPFDGEGVRRQRVSLVEKGVVKRLVYARSSAAKMKACEHKDKVGTIEATGHGFPLPNEMGEAPMNVVFARPDDPRTVEEMIASSERGILVTRLWYIREVDPYEKILTGMTRDGTFYIEDGKLRHGLLNFRFNESLLHMLSNVEEMGEPVRASGEESFDMVVPAMKVKDFNFTEVTKF